MGYAQKMGLKRCRLYHWLFSSYSLKRELFLSLILKCILKLGKKDFYILQLESIITKIDFTSGPRYSHLYLYGQTLLSAFFPFLIIR